MLDYTVDAPEYITHQNASKSVVKGSPVAEGSPAPAGEEPLAWECLPYLVNTTKLPSRNYVLERYLLSEIAAELLPNTRCSSCRKAIIPGKKGVSVIYSPKYTRASYGNLMTCGSVWLCAVCAAKISELRRVELVAAAGYHQGGLALLTFTLAHKKNDKLADTLNLLDTAFSKLFEGHWWVNFQARWNFLGKVTALEVTYGRNGWHPHKHCLFFFSGWIGSDQVAQMQKELTQHYLELLKKVGGSALPGLAVDVRVAEKNSDIVAEYLAKTDKLPESPYWGIESELTKSYVKKTKGGKGLTFWQLLKLAVTGEKEAVLLVREYEAALRGKTSLKYSRGLKQLLKVNDQTDQDLSDQVEKDGLELALLAHEIWRQVCAKKLRGQLLAAAGSGCVDDLYRFLDENNISCELN